MIARKTHATKTQCASKHPQTYIDFKLMSESPPAYNFHTSIQCFDSRVTWNFQKYLINKEGIIEKIISPRTRPDSEEIVSWITDVD